MDNTKAYQNETIERYFYLAALEPVVDLLEVQILLIRLSTLMLGRGGV